MTYLDTHVVVWLYAGDLHRFHRTDLKRLETDQLAICPIVLLELAYLNETGRLREDARVVRDRMRQALDLEIRDLSFSRVIEEALMQSWTRDPFDRIIVAQARIENSDLLSKDDGIRTHYAKTVWHRN